VGERVFASEMKRFNYTVRKNLDFLANILVALPLPQPLSRKRGEGSLTTFHSTKCNSRSATGAGINNAVAMPNRQIAAT
jgi:hypothetical protein